MFNMINIKGLNKAKVLQALFNISRLGAEPMSLSDAESIIKKQTKFDYLRGRVMKVDLSGDEFDNRLFDRDNGTNAAQAAIDSIR